MPTYWYKADLMFVCPTCKQQSKESIIARDQNHNPNAVAKAIMDRVRPIYCRLCKSLCPQDTDIHLGMNDISEEEASKINFGSPPSVA
jgi:formate hydrogenlyase subunit 6/NADH:ubiquinone oxidoreductase subunit I